MRDAREMGPAEILREVTEAERLVALILRRRARGEEPIGRSSKQEAQMLADLMELAELGRILAAASPGTAGPRPSPPRAPTPAAAAERVKRRQRIAAARDAAVMLRHQALLEARIQTGRHPQARDLDIRRVAFLSELAEMAAELARTGERPAPAPAPATAQARIAAAERAAKLRFSPVVTPTRH